MDLKQRLFKTELSLSKKEVAHLDISHSAPGLHTVKGTGALYMEIYRSAQYQGIEWTDLFS